MQLSQPLSALAYAAANAWEVMQSTGRRFYKNRHHRAFLWWEVGNVCLMPIREEFACAACGETPECIRQETKGYINCWEPGIWGDIIRHHRESTWSKNGHDYAKGIYRSSQRRI